MAPVPPHQATFSVPPAAPAPSVNVPSQSILSKTQRFIEDNQRAILIGCGVLAVSGAGYYLYNRNGTPLGGSDDGNKPGGSSSASKKKKKNKKKGGSGLQGGFLKGDGADGPLVEEIEKPKAKATEGVAEGEKQESATSHLADIPEAGALAAMAETVSHWSDIGIECRRLTWV